MHAVLCDDEDQVLSASILDSYELGLSLVEGGWCLVLSGLPSALQWRLSSLSGLFVDCMAQGPMNAG